MSKKDILFMRQTGYKKFYMSIGNSRLSVSHYECCSSKIPHSFDGYKIVHISDYHNHDFGKNQSKLYSIISGEHPDNIFITGDLIDRRRPDIETAVMLINKLIEIAPVFFVSGNHDTKSADSSKLSMLLKNAGVKILDNSYVTIEKNGESIRVAGLPDPSLFGCDSNTVDNDTMRRLEEMLSSLIKKDSAGFQILLSHRPDLIGLYSACGADLVFSGHAHGGQIRLPLIGGLYAPGQGIFPRLTSGMHRYENTALVISRGLGNSLFPLRLFNPPEIVILTLKTKQ